MGVAIDNRRLTRLRHMMVLQTAILSGKNKLTTAIIGNNLPILIAC